MIQTQQIYHCGKKRHLNNWLTCFIVQVKSQTENQINETCKLILSVGFIVNRQTELKLAKFCLVEWPLQKLSASVLWKRAKWLIIQLFTQNSTIIISILNLNLNLRYHDTPFTQGFLLQPKNGRLEVLELMALFIFKTGTCDAKNSWQFFVDAIFCFVKICFQTRGTNTT